MVAEEATIRLDAFSVLSKITVSADTKYNEHHYDLRNTKENVIEGMKDIRAEAAGSSGLDATTRKLVIMALSSGPSQETSIVNSLNLLQEGG